MFRKIASQSARSAGALLCATGAATSICDPVNTDSWEEKWRSYTKEGVTPGFHESSTNTNLSRFTDNLIKDSSIAYRILVPLCGKSQDLLYLATFGDVVGIECVQDAISQFGQENQLVPDPNILKETNGKFFRFAAEEGAYQIAPRPVSIAKYDLFDLPKLWSQVSADPVTGETKFDCVWDRASFVAIDPKKRDAYVKAILDQLTPAGRILLSVLEIDQASNPSSPPYSVSEKEVHHHFGKYFEIRLLAKAKSLSDIRDAFEVTYILERKSPSNWWFF